MEIWQATLLAALCSLLAAWGGARLALKGSLQASDVALSNAMRNEQLQRDLKVADYRVAWIQRLRDEMAVFQSWGMTPGIDQASTREFYEHGTRIELLLNPNDQDYAYLQNLMYRLLEAKDKDSKYMVNAEYVTVCQRILKREWDVAKKEIRNDFFG